MKVKKYAIILFVFIVINGYAQEDLYVWPNISTLRIASEEVNDSFLIYIKLPDNYEQDNNSYPLLILLDGDLLFPIAASVTQYLEYGEHVPNMIIVGVGYGSLDWQKGNQRSRDYTAHPREGRPYQGGAKEFLAFLGTELLPFIEESYRIDPSNKIIMGHSLGGQLVLYALLNQPSLFSGYLASSPAIFNWKKYYDRQFEEFKQKSHARCKHLFISVGELEDQKVYLEIIQEFVKKTEAANISDLELEFKEIADASHFMAGNMALVHGLISYFSQR